MSSSVIDLNEELDDILKEGIEYAGNCHRAEEAGWFYPDDEDSVNDSE